MYKNCHNCDKRIFEKDEYCKNCFNKETGELENWSEKNDKLWFE